MTSKLNLRSIEVFSWNHLMFFLFNAFPGGVWGDVLWDDPEHIPRGVRSEGPGQVPLSLPGRRGTGAWRSPLDLRAVHRRVCLSQESKTVDPFHSVMNFLCLTTFLSLSPFAVLASCYWNLIRFIGSLPFLFQTQPTTLTVNSSFLAQ